MLKSVPYLAALPSAVLLICLSAHADTPGLSVAHALADPRRPAEQVSLQRVGIERRHGEPSRVSQARRDLDLAELSRPA
jgi:hypothetical protein